MEYNDNDEDGREPEVSPEEYLAERKRRMRRSAAWSFGGGLVMVAVSVALAFYILSTPELAKEYEVVGTTVFAILQRNVLFLIGLFFVAAGAWGFYEARRLKFEDLVPSPEAVDFFRESESTSHLYTYIVVGCLVAVFIAQLQTPINPETREWPPVLIGGLMSIRIIENGEWWRLLTSGVLHGGFLHIYFNAQAFFGFGGLIEVVADRARMAIIFVLAVIGGGLLSLTVANVENTVGASGGILGLVGYLVIYGYRRKRQLPPGFLRSLLVNVVMIAALGVVGYKFINNFAHFGGFLVGVVYGLLTIPRDISANPREISALTEGAGMIAMGIIVFTAIFTVLLVTEQISF